MEDAPAELCAREGDASAWDRAWQTGLRLAYRGLSVYWRAFRPRTEGACVLVWHVGRLVLVRHSYKPGLGIPAGAPRPGEAPRAAAVRELREEVGLDVAPTALDRLGRVESRHEGKRDLLVVFETEWPEPPRLAIDRREIVWAGLEDPEATPRTELWPPLPAILARSRRYATTSSSSEASPGTPIRSGKP